MHLEGRTRIGQVRQFHVAANIADSTLGWAPFAVAGVMQGMLLGMCLAWKQRQHKLGLDDFGHPVHAGVDHVPQETSPLLGSSQ